jgi:hypothetical protein
MTRGLAGAATLLIAGGTWLGAASTLEYAWDVEPAAADCAAPGSLYEVDCRHDVGARFGEFPRPAYVEPALWQVYGGCRPIFAPVAGAAYGETGVGSPLTGRAAFEQLDRTWARSDERLDVACTPKSYDPVCAKVLALGSGCKPAGSRAVRCSLTKSQREAVLR